MTPGSLLLGRTALVAGASRGIGRATAIALAGELAAKRRAAVADVAEMG